MTEREPESPTSVFYLRTINRCCFMQRALNDTSLTIRTPPCSNYGSWLRYSLAALRRILGIAFGPDDNFVDVERALRDIGQPDDRLHQVIRTGATFPLRRTRPPIIACDTTDLTFSSLRRRVAGAYLLWI